MRKFIDYTGRTPRFEHHECLTPALMQSIRQGNEHKLMVVVDNAWFLGPDAPHVVRDHINLSGNNPLVGPNDPCGDRFPILTGIYCTDVPGTLIAGMPQAVVAGLAPGIVPVQQEKEFLSELGVGCFCYNLVPTMIIAAHAGWKLVGLVVPKGQSLSEEILAELMENSR